jgi:hypothetical protein
VAIAAPCIAFGLVWLIGQLIYFTRPAVVAAFRQASESADGVKRQGTADVWGKRV